MKFLFILILCLSWLFEFFLWRIRKRQLHRPFPEDLPDYFDSQTKDLSVSYQEKTGDLRLIHVSVNHVLLLAIMGFDLVFHLVQIFSRWGFQEEAANVLAAFLLAIPFFVNGTVKSAKQVFSVNEKHGMNRTTPRKFLLDVLRSGFFLFLLLGVSTYFIIEGSSQGASLVSLLYFISLVINQRLAFKMTPLPDSGLKTRILQFCEDQHLRFRKILVLNASQRSGQVNALFQGFGRWSRIVLFDTLIEKLPEDEVMAIFAHEVGHAKNRDQRKLILPIILLTIISTILYVSVSKSMSVARAFGFPEPNPVLSFVLMFSLWTPFWIALSILRNPRSRRGEIRADQFAAKEMGKAVTIDALIAITRTNLGVQNPHPVDEFLFSTHPPLHQRIQGINKVPD